MGQDFKLTWEGFSVSLCPEWFPMYSEGIVAPDPQITPLKMTPTPPPAQLQFSKDRREYHKQKCNAISITVCKSSPSPTVVICLDDQITNTASLYLHQSR